MTADKLKLNDDKTELIVIGTRPQLDKISISELRIDHVKVSAVCNVRNLGKWFDNHLSMKTAINKTCQSELYHLHNIGRIKRFLSFEGRKSIVHAVVMSRIDYCNSLLYGVAATNQFQRVQNAAVRLVWSLPRHEHVTSSFIRLHWLPIKFRINLKIAMLCFKWIHGHALNYLKRMVAIQKTSIYNLRSSTSIQLEDHSRRSKETLGDRAFSDASAKIWSSLPKSLQSQQNFNTLKSLLKTHHFREAFNL